MDVVVVVVVGVVLCGSGVCIFGLLLSLLFFKPDCDNDEGDGATEGDKARTKSRVDMENGVNDNEEDVGLLAVVASSSSVTTA